MQAQEHRWPNECDPSASGEGWVWAGGLVGSGTVGLLLMVSFVLEGDDTLLPSLVLVHLYSSPVKLTSIGET